MKARAVIVLCWLSVVCGSAIAAIYFRQLFAGPALEMSYSRATRRVTAVVPGGAADRAGLRTGDLIESIAAARPGWGATPLYSTRAGDAVPIVFTRDGVTRTTRVVAESFAWTQARALRSGGGQTLSAINNAMIVPLNLWMMLLGVILLLLRPDDRAARISAMSLISWASGYFITGMAGIGAFLAPLSYDTRLAIYAVDALFTWFFFAFCVDFALIFAAEHDRPPRPWMRILAYLAPLPIFIETMRVVLRRIQVDPAAHGPISATLYETMGPALLVIALVLLARRAFRVTDLNARRRITLIFVSLLPGVTGFVVQVLTDRLNGGFVAHEASRLFGETATMAGSAIYAYAVVRHRMYGVRVLVRRSIRYAFARGTLFVAMSLPLIGMAAFLYAHRNDSLASLISGTPAVYFLIIVPLVLVIRYRGRILDALDRRYFREQYDARRLLLHVVSVVRDGSDMFGLSRVSLDEIEKALHPKHISLWRADTDGREFRRELARGDAPAEWIALANSGALPALLATDAEPLDVFSRLSRPMLKRLPQSERDWIHASGAYLVVPLLIEQRLVGLMVLGERMSEEPYSHEDRDLLRTIAAQLALTFDYSRLKESPSFVWTPANRTPTSMLDEVRLCARCGRCFSSEHDVCEFDHERLGREDGVPRVIEDKYILTRILGRGGMGSVYLATQKRLNRPVAVKVLLSHLVSSSTMRARFEREARIVARLKHPSIVMIHDFGVLGTNHAYLVMEYLEGGTLRKNILSGPMPVDAMLEIFRPICDAVDSAHRAGVIHRDLKPENIMLVDESGKQSLRVLDFGLAKMTGPLGDEEATLVQSGQSIGLVGTLLYLAPEVLSGKPADAKSDQYSLGLMAYEMLCGGHPFGDRTDLASIVKAHTQEEPPPVADLVPGVPERVSAAIRRAIAKESAERFPTVGEFLAEMLCNPFS